MKKTIKPSLWNSYISLNEQGVLIYNSKLDQFVVVKEQWVIDLIKESKIELIPAEITNKLINYGVFIPVETDEAAELEHLIKKIDEDKSIFNLIINPTLQCNFRCWYCYEEHKPNSHMTATGINSVQRLIERIIYENTNLRLLNLSFFGGEPLLQFSSVVTPIIKHASSICQKKNKQLSIHFTTNGSLISKNIISFLNEYSTSFQITLDGGKEFHNKTRRFISGEPSFNLIFRNIINIASSGMKVLVRINYTMENLHSVTDLFKLFEKLDPILKRNISIDLQPVWQETSSLTSNFNFKEFVSKIKKKFEIAGYQVHHQSTFNYVQNSCYSYKQNEMLINYNGDVFSCTARDFISENRMGKLLADGKVIWENGSLKAKMNCKFKKTICRTCRIAPICGGGCRTKCMENMHHDKCNLNFTDDQINDMILERFELYFMDN